MSLRGEIRLAAEENFAETLASAHNGCGESLGRMLEACRQYLLLIANAERTPALAAKDGASDLVQETLLAAGRDFASFRGTTEGELRRWLRKILVRHLQTVQRRYIDTQKRAACREVSLIESFWAQAGSLPAYTTSPSHHFMNVELKERVELALASLPERYRRVIELRNRQNTPFNEVGRQLQLSSEAARQLWARAIKQLRKEMGDFDI